MLTSFLVAVWLNDQQPHVYIGWIQAFLRVTTADDDDPLILADVLWLEETPDREYNSIWSISGAAATAMDVAYVEVRNLIGRVALIPSLTTDNAEDENIEDEGYWIEDMDHDCERYTFRRLFAE